ncbi:hypothetical protein N8367_03995 [Amylibacter sp.]|jgi:hypothetical protein|nr:hypothetical protein [Amylibacter sp.]
MPITREQFEQIREELGAHTSWALWTPQGVKAKSNVGDLSIFNDEDKISNTLHKLNPNIILAGLNAASGKVEEAVDLKPFANFHSSYAAATDYKIRYATAGTALEGAFMTDVIKDHVETNSNIVNKSLKNNPEYERLKVEEFFREINSVSNAPTIFAFGSMAYELIQKYNHGRLPVYKLYHYAYQQSATKFREETMKTLTLAGFTRR